MYTNSGVWPNLEIQLLGKHMIFNTCWETLNVVVSRTIFSRSAVVQSPEFPLRSTIFTCSRCNSMWREGMCRKIELRWTQWINGSNYKISTTSSVWFGSSLKERSCFHKLPSEVLYSYIVTKLNSCRIHSCSTSHGFQIPMPLLKEWYNNTYYIWTVYYINTHKYIDRRSLCSTYKTQDQTTS